MKFATFLREKRLQAGLSQDTVAKALGYTNRANWCKLEAGKFEIKMSSLFLFADLLKTTASALLAEYEAK